MAFNSALNICDGMFVGHGVGSNALAAINIVVPLFLICAGVGLMFGIGASVTGGIRLASEYLLWLLPGLVFFYLQCAGMMLIRLDGSPRYAMYLNCSHSL